MLNRECVAFRVYACNPARIRQSCVNRASIILRVCQRRAIPLRALVSRGCRLIVGGSLHVVRRGSQATAQEPPHGAHSIGRREGVGGGEACAVRACGAGNGATGGASAAGVRLRGRAAVGSSATPGHRTRTGTGTGGGRRGCDGGSDGGRVTATRCRRRAVITPPLSCQQS